MPEKEKRQQNPDGIRERKMDSHPVGDTRQFGETRALILERDAILCGYHMAMLRRLGIKCTSADDRADVLQASQDVGEERCCYDICFISWNMLRGGEIEKMHGEIALGRRMQIVCLAKKGTVDPDEARDVGADALLVYPFDQETLYHFLSTL